MKEFENIMKSITIVVEFGPARDLQDRAEAFTSRPLAAGPISRERAPAFPESPR